jgi:hypothetical protein
MRILRFRISIYSMLMTLDIKSRQMRSTGSILILMILSTNNYQCCLPNDPIITSIRIVIIVGGKHYIVHSEYFIVEFNSSYTVDMHDQ